MKIKSLVFAVIVLLLATFAGAQQCGNTGPNAGFATTPYSANYFSATFNGPVTFTEAGRSDDNQSSNYTYLSKNANVVQLVTVRIVDHDIPPDQTSADFYANDDRTPGEDTSYRKTGTWCSDHGDVPYTYTFHVYTRNGSELRKRTRNIIVNSRTVIFLEQIALNSYDDRNEWLDFEYSLRIK